MGVEIPNDFDVDLTGIPSTLHLHVDTLPSIHFDVDSLPVLHLALDSIPRIQLALEPLEIRPLEIRPLEIRLTEFPSVRGHLPADFCIGLSILGYEVVNLRLCGEAQVITEPYRPNPCEICGPPGTGVVQIQRSPGAAQAVEFRTPG